MYDEYIFINIKCVTKQIMGMRHEIFCEFFKNNDVDQAVSSLPIALKHSLTASIWVMWEEAFIKCLVIRKISVWPCGQLYLW